jgi:hypothetical protein
MRRVAVAVAILVAVPACGILKKGAGDDGGASVTVGATGAANEKDVLRYPEEVKVASQQATVLKDGTQPRTFPGTGVPVATLGKGYTVTKLATYFSTGVLVIFDDPTTPGQKLLGWLGPEDLGAVATATTSATGTASGGPRPAVAVIAKDAGVATAADAGGAPSAAASAPTSPTVILFTQIAPDGKCPAGFAPAPGGCRRPCVTDATCPGAGTQGVVCKSFGGKKFCSATK